LRKLCKTPDTVVKRTRGKLLMNLIRMDQTNMAKNIFQSKPRGRRKVGRLRLRWMEDIENDT
jgi:hypothetical protein